MHTQYYIATQKIFLGIALGLVACVGVGCNKPASSVAAPPTMAIATPDPAIPQLPAMTAEGPLSGSPVEIPAIWIVPSSQSKESLAEYFRTTVEQLDWANPGLDDFVVAGTLVAIPPAYRLSSAESLSAIASATGVSEDLIRAANPVLAASGVLTEGTVLAMPAIVIMSDTTTLGAMAASLNLSDQALLSANPELAGKDTIDAGTVLVVPPTDDPQ